jgi:hypothetical protein
VLHRNAPSILLVEMSADLPSHEDAFSAESVDSWMIYHPLDMVEPRLSVSSFVKQLMSEDWEESVVSKTPKVYVHGLFLVLVVCAG